jgi:poly(3-hydroxybutyrate) depolymerase
MHLPCIGRDGLSNNFRLQPCCCDLGIRMLYQISESLRTVNRPLARLAQSTSGIYSGLASFFNQNPYVKAMHAGNDMLYRICKDYTKPEFSIGSVDLDGSTILIKESVRLSKPFCELRFFERFTSDMAVIKKIDKQPTVLIVAPMSGHHATLLRNTVRELLPYNNVFITDWLDARDVPLSDGLFSLDDYVNYVQEFIRCLQSKYGNCHVLSVCQPTVPTLAAVSLMASRGELTPLTLTMMGGPIDARQSPTKVDQLAVEKSYEWFEGNLINRVPASFAGVGRRVYPGFMQLAGFLSMNPDIHSNHYYKYFKDVANGRESEAEAHRKFYDEYNAVIDMDASFYLDTIRVVFQEFHLAKGTWKVRNPHGFPEIVRPQDIKKTAILTVEGEADDITGIGQTKAAHSLCSSLNAKMKEHIEVPKVGHYGIFSGKTWANSTRPQVQKFIDKHSKVLA